MSCDKCKGRLFTVDEKTGNAIPCECQIKLLKQEIKSKVMTITRIPPVFWNQTFDGYKELLPLKSRDGSGAFNKLSGALQKSNNATLQILEQYIHNPISLYDKETPTAKALWIHGEYPCSGHTSLACLLAKALWQVKVKTVFFNMNEIRNRLVDFESSTMTPKQFEDKVIDNYDAVIIDDIYTKNKLFSSDNDYLLGAFTSLIERIIYQNKLLICTSDRELDNITSEVHRDALSVIVPYTELLPIFGTLESKYYK